MTDLLLKPEDTGEIPAVDPGPDTRNLAPYAVLPPALRRPTAEVPALDLGDYRATLDGELVPSRPGPPPPLPSPPPQPTPGYVGRHRAAPRWYGPLVEGIAVAWARVRRSM